MSKVEVPDWVRDGITRRPDPDPAPIPAVVSAPAPVATAPVTPRWTIRFEDGRLVVIASSAYLGREPTAPDDAPAGAQLVGVGADEKSVSKTHLAIEVDGEAASLIDLRSTNGVSIESEGSDPIRCRPGVATPVRSGDVIRFGARRIVIGYGV